jgi:Zn-dependent protease/predicted transcriptional regulator
MDHPSSQAPNERHAQRHHRAWSLYLITLAGIPVYLHFTLLLMLAFIAFFEISKHQKIFGGLLAVILIFASITLHELGHALMARRFKISTLDIVLYPIGGVARLQSMGEGLQEFWIALAGPAVNVLIAAILVPLTVLTGQWIALDRVETGEVPVLQMVLMVNVILVIFNLIPAFPMDGGRVLRALLTRFTTRDKATAIAAKVGQALAIVFMLGGFLTQNFMLMFIGLFVFLAAGQEFAMTRSQTLLNGRMVRDAMITHFETLAHGDSLGRAADLLLATSQQDFPVMGGEQVIGVLNRRELIQGLATQGRDHIVAEVMTREFPRLTPRDPLQRALELLRDGQNQNQAVMVFEGEKLIGYINNENMAEYVMIAQAREK